MRIGSVNYRHPVGIYIGEDRVNFEGLATLSGGYSLGDSNRLRDGRGKVRPLLRSHNQGSLAHQITQLLEELGSTAEEVSRSLQRSGVKATPRSETDCALAVYLSAVLGSDPRVASVKVSSTAVIVRRRSIWRPPTIVTLPAPCRNFVAAFDSDGYPELIRKTPDRRPNDAKHSM
jgi:hypothetical protein